MAQVPDARVDAEGSKIRTRRASNVVTLVGVAAASASGLTFEVALTRVFAVAQFYHFAFLSVSLALLGFGASGSALTAFPGLGRGGARRWGWLAAAQSVTTVGAYAVVNALPLDSFAIAWDRRQVVYLMIYYMSLAVPFFFGGLVVAVLLAGADSARPIPSHRVYAASLAGSGIGALLALPALDRLGGEGTIVLAAAVAMGAAAAFTSLGPVGAMQRVLPAVVVGLLVTAVVLPAPLEMNLSPYKDLTAALRYPEAAIVETVWDRGTRIDLVDSAGIRSLPGLSLTYAGAPPDQDGLTFDGDDLNPVPRTLPEHTEFATHMLTSLAFRLRPGATALVLEPRGGLDVLVALASGASTVRAVASHGGSIRAIRATGPSVYDDGRVSISHADPRTFVERTREQFDVIDLALTAPYRPVASGAYSLAEDYGLTVEAFEQYLSHLSPGGILTAARWVQLPPSEETRLLATAVAALRRMDIDPASTVVMLRGYSAAQLLVQPDGFTATEVAQIEAFAESERFDLVTAPGLDPADTNRFNVVPDEAYSTLAAALVTTEDPGPIYDGHQFDIAPATDDHPFFGHYFKWSQTSTVLDSLGRTWQPFGGAGYFVLIALFAISTLAALVLIAAPMLIRRRSVSSAPAALRWWTLGYFGLLGTAFLFVEIPLIQQYILLVGHPAVSFVVVVFAILVASGAGSAASRRIAWLPGAITLTSAAVAYPFLVRWLTPFVLPAAPAARVLIAIAMVAPLGFLMGIMFPWGLAHLEARCPALVPWAWAINGTVSVMAASAAAILALGFGFSFVVRLGAFAYGFAALLARPARTAVASVTPQRE